ncbi:hypothetical protein SHEEN_38 [Mycobacterium phage Sheen]|uniref:Uncharacterized protein n=1 Tax=Mycobacterium phage Sheen TaxID=1589274 RepID=A0A0B5A5W8_9CAUD|nr:hypothetical protein AVV31_gp56 [Mycobacterium phage Sheen]AJD82456.1 hypothetical protein SHEEN_38 [Mycobacterium phage Sheen]
MRYPQPPTIPADYDVQAVANFRVEDGKVIFQWNGEDFWVIATEVKYDDQDDRGFRYYRPSALPPEVTSFTFDVRKVYRPKPEPKPKRTVARSLGLRRPS